MSRYGEPLEGDKLIGQFEAQQGGRYSFELHPDLWKCSNTVECYGARVWQKAPFTYWWLEEVRKAAAKAE